MAENQRIVLLTKSEIELMGKEGIEKIERAYGAKVKEWEYVDEADGWKPDTENA